MAIKEDIKRERAPREVSETSPAVPAPAAPSTDATEPEERDADAALAAPEEEVHDVALVGESASPTQLGTKRFVYAAYFTAAIAVAFVMSKVVGFAWYKVQSYKPALGEPRDEIVMPVSAAAGAATALYFWYRTRARELAEEVATEMSKVTWPSRTEVTNGTFVVIVTTIVSTVFFALMDRFWGFITNLVYGG
jgi:preprotein translocase subunit SecE